MDLSIIIPAHNEATTIGGSRFMEAIRWIRNQYPDSELIIVNDGSSDDTSAVADAIADVSLNIPHSGKGAALCHGIKTARGAIAVWADADWSVPVTEIPRLIDQVRGGTDYVMGSRGWARPDSPLMRLVGSCLYTIACRITFDWDLTDTQCGMKAGRLSALTTIVDNLHFFGADIPQDCPSTDALFDVECLLIARSLGMRISVKPVAWKHFRNRSSVRYGPLLRRIGRDFQKVKRAYQNGHYPPAPHT